MIDRHRRSSSVPGSHVVIAVALDGATTESRSQHPDAWRTARPLAATRTSTHLRSAVESAEHATGRRLPDRERVDCVVVGADVRRPRVRAKTTSPQVARVSSGARGQHQIVFPQAGQPRCSRWAHQPTSTRRALQPAQISAAGRPQPVIARADSARPRRQRAQRRDVRGDGGVRAWSPRQRDHLADVADLAALRSATVSATGHRRIEQVVDLESSRRGRWQVSRAC